jgi:hypothetical protein
MAPMKLARKETFGSLRISVWLSMREVTDIGKLIYHDNYMGVRESFPSKWKCFS